MTDNKIPGNNMADNKWWEFYIIRYSMGTMIGAVIVYAMLKSSPELNQFLLLPKDNKLEYFHFIFLALFGLTYCYIASAPILVLHASRFALSYDHNGRVFKPIWFMSMFVLVTALIILSFIFPNIIDMLAKAIVVTLAFLILVPQWILVFYSISRADDNFAFYRKLSSKRESDKSDIRESYKHLREHGNSFSIFFLEIVLGVILISLGYENIKFPLGFIFLWILPAVFVWCIGTSLENKFANEKI